MHRTNLRWLQTVTALLFAFAVPLLASDGPENRQSLKGIKTMAVLVENLNASEIADGLTVEQLQNDVELRLRKAGINVVAAASDPYLYLNVNMIKVSAVSAYAYNCEARFSQMVTSLNGTTLISGTWGLGSVGIVRQQNMRMTVRDTVGELIDRFLNAYLSVNPK